VVVINASSTDVFPLLDNILSDKDSRQGVAVLGRCRSASVSELLSRTKARSQMTLFISSDDVECRQNMMNTSKLIGMFAKFRINIVHIFFERTEFQARHLGMWSHDIGMLLRRYIATLEAIVRHDVTTRVVLHVDVKMPQHRNMTLLCSDPFDMSRDFSDVILSSVYSFANVYRNLHTLNYVYNILYVHDART